MRGTWIIYSDAELAWLAANSTLPIGDYHSRFQAAFDRPDVSADNVNSLRKRKGWRTGRTGHFAKGGTPANKGKPCPEGKGGRHPNAIKTQFRKGRPRTGKAAENYKPIGSERVTVDGYVERKVHDGLPMQSRWKQVHRINWEAEHGPVPAGMFLKCLDGNPGNTAPTNWEPMPRAAQPYLIGHRGFDYEAASPEVRPSILALAKVRVARKSAQRGAS